VSEPRPNIDKKQNILNRLARIQSNDQFTEELWFLIVAIRKLPGNVSVQVYCIVFSSLVIVYDYSNRPVCLLVQI